MVVQCNRFVFNFDTFQQQKLNSRFEFDRYLNVEAHTKEGMDWRNGMKYAPKLTVMSQVSQEILREWLIVKVSRVKVDKSRVPQRRRAVQTVSQDSEMPPRPPGQYEIYPKSYYEYDLVGCCAFR